MGWVVNTTSRLLHPVKDPVPIVEEARFAPGMVGQVREISPLTGIRFLYLPARSESLYLLSYPAHTKLLIDAVGSL
jgi:hypothetical protein